MKPNTFGFNWKATGQWNIDVTFFIEYRKSKVEKLKLKICKIYVIKLRPPTLHGKNFNPS